MYDSEERFFIFRFFFLVSPSRLGHAIPQIEESRLRAFLAVYDGENHADKISRTFSLAPAFGYLQFNVDCRTTHCVLLRANENDSFLEGKSSLSLRSTYAVTNFHGKEILIKL